MPALILDLDGTLVDTVYAHVECARRLGAAATECYVVGDAV